MHAYDTIKVREQVPGNGTTFLCAIKFQVKGCRNMHAYDTIKVREQVAASCKEGFMRIKVQGKRMKNNSWI
jgi:hypothetical protein